MKITTLRRLLTLVLVLCMVAPMMLATAANTTCHIEVSIVDDKKGIVVSAQSSKYLTGEAPLAGEVVTLIKKSYEDLEIFRSIGMKRILDAGIKAYANSDDAAWAKYLDRYFVDVNSDLKTLLTDKTVCVGALTPRNHYTVAFTNDVLGDRGYGTTYTVTVTMYLDGQFNADPKTIGLAEMLSVEEHYAFLKGSDGSFRPEDNLTRAEAAQVFYNLLKDKNVQVTASFEDVPADAWYATAVNTIASLGIVEGDGKGHYFPNDAITRAEFVALATRFVTAVEGKVTFGDAQDAAWANDEIATAVGYGWVQGYEDGNFRPNDAITRAEVTAVVTRMLERKPDQAFIDANLSQLNTFKDVSKGHWAYYLILEAANGHDHGYSTSGEEVWSTLK